MADMILDIYSQIGAYESGKGVSDDKNSLHNPFGIAGLEVVGTKKPFAHRRETKRKSTVCSECETPMYRSAMEYICDQCGKIDPIIGGDIDIAEHGGPEGVNDYNTSSNSAAPVRITGPNSYIFQKKLISTTSNYKKQQRRNTLDELNTILHQYDGPKPPPNVVKQAAEFYYQVQQHCIKRGNVRRGTMAACLYRKCIENGISRKPKEIAAIFGLPQTELSNGEKILDDLFSEGKLGSSAETSDTLVDNDASAKVNQFYFKEQKELISYLARYFESLNIPETYMEFAQSLVHFTIKYRIAESSIMSSKCAGVIYILSLKVPELNISGNDISASCVISKSTFNRYYRDVIATLNSRDINTQKIRSRMRHIFKKNRIPLE
jgi:transcription initiation factor TFIIIB Brf1 subunit/transcription initiation factor TFIIB